MLLFKTKIIFVNFYFKILMLPTFNCKLFIQLYLFIFIIHNLITVILNVLFIIML